MEIVIADDAGWCFGVRQAVENVETALGGKRRIVALAPIVHNRHVMERLQEAGLAMAKSPCELDSGDVLVVPSHGATVEELCAARERGVEVLDLTCPRVRFSHAAARRITSEGRRVLIIGDAGHTEVRAIASHAGRDTVVVADEVEAAQLPPGQRWGVITQTTMPGGRVAAIIEVVARRSAEAVLEPTACHVAAGMQETVRLLAAGVETVIVVGGRASANTANLAAIARAAGAATYHVEDASEVDPSWFQNTMRVGIAAGASTPDRLIEEVVAKVKEIDERDRALEAPDSVSKPEPEQPGTGPVDQQAPAGGQQEQGTEPQAAGAPADTPQAGAGAEVAQADEQQGPTSMEGVRLLSVGDVVPGRVVEVRPGEGVMVDVGYKSEGMVPLNELAKRSVADPLSQIAVGQEIMVQVLKLEGEEGNLLLSKRRADEEHTWGSLQAAFATGTPVQGRVTQAVKGGLLVDLGVRAFLPASHVGAEFVRDLNPWVGKEVHAKVIEIDRKDRKVILSERLYLDEDRKEKAEGLWDRIKEGAVLTGVVKRLTDFGAFVDLGGIDGLLHISELSWRRVGHPSEVVHEGETIDVKVLRVDRERNRISLGKKQVDPDPWTKAVAKYPANSTTTGKVVRLVPFGAFVQLEDGIDGLVHISQIASHRIGKPEEVLQVGQEVRVKVLAVNNEARRISLSIREVEQDGSRHDYRSYMANQSSGEVTVGEMLAARGVPEGRHENAPFAAAETAADKEEKQEDPESPDEPKP
ncbi:MAG: bifunctional 4-hydroxy-3-methylbut-2-enyl diphosphate reductase/30S ribosomal protein S1 [Bacillota bacterium]|nr:bifunctional 4-hydroxy-3-methylbut-2-enyl diphosphate reductase/30S ribosomal protein S1 [Bacillota bacterium]